MCDAGARTGFSPFRTLFFFCEESSSFSCLFSPVLWPIDHTTLKSQLTNKLHSSEFSPAVKKKSKMRKFGKFLASFLSNYLCPPFPKAMHETFFPGEKIEW